MGVVDENLFICQEEKIELKSNLKLAIYTDGVTEGYKENGDMLESKGVEDIFKENNCQDSIDKIRNILIYSNEVKLHDDITLLGFEF